MCRARWNRARARASGPGRHRLRASRRKYGGEEFALLLPGADPQDAAQVAEAIRQRIKALQIVVGEQRIPVTVSLGLASAAGAGDEIRIMEVIREADAALYRAKREGRNRVVAARVPDAMPIQPVAAGALVPGREEWRG